MREQHLDLLPLATRSDVGVGGGEVAGEVERAAYYGLIRRYEANLLAPLTLMTPLATIAFGVMLTGDRLDARMIAGATLALAGVLVVALRARGREPALLAEREVG